MARTRFRRRTRRRSRFRGRRRRSTRYRGRIGRRMDTERKFFDVGAGPFEAFIGTPLFVPLSIIPIGLGRNSRIGGAIRQLSIQVNITAQLASPADRQIRWMLVVDRSPDGGIITEAGVLADPLTPIESYLNLNLNRRFRVLMGGKRTLSNEGNKAFTMTKFRRLNIQTRYLADTAAPSQNQLAFFFWSNGTIGVGVTAFVTFRQRYVG